jgi:steroid 5-alpha reductase family enzyme
VGLWRWSRHPNYFFEWFCWLAYPVIALSVDDPWSFATLLAPAFMYWILVYVTGIPPLADAALAGRALSRVSVAYQCVLPAAPAMRKWHHELHVHDDRDRRTGPAA